MATAAERERLRRIVLTAPHHFQQSHRWRRVQPIRADAASAKSEIELAAEPGPQRRAAVGAVGDAFLPDTLGSSRDFVARAELPPEALEAEFEESLAVAVLNAVLLPGVCLRTRTGIRAVRGFSAST